MANRGLVLRQVPPAGPGLSDLLRDLAAAMRGDGPALALRPPSEPPERAPQNQVLRDEQDDGHDPTVAVLRTSGSTGAPKDVLLQASALLASASATHDRLGGPGQWVLALPAHHVAGLQVLVRCLIARVQPVAVDLSGGFSVEGFVDAVGRCGASRRYTAVVPTQVARILDAGQQARTALASLDGVLVGGAALAAPLRERAEVAGVRIVETYGMSETCGGCVYDGVPLDGVRVLTDDDGRIHLGGPVIARGYATPQPDRSCFTADDAGTRWFATPDRGTWDGTHLRVDGRLDDVIITGGVNVAPLAVEQVLLAMPGVSQAVVVGVPDEEWGTRVAAALVMAPRYAAPDLRAVRELAGRRLGPAAAPRQLLVLPELPMLGPGKPDRNALARLAREDRG